MRGKASIRHNPPVENADASDAFWQRLLAVLPPTRRAIYREGRYLGFSGEAFRVAFAKPFFRERALAYREEVERAGNALLGRPVRVLVEWEEPAPPPPAPTPARRGRSFPSEEKLLALARQSLDGEAWRALRSVQKRLKETLGPALLVSLRLPPKEEGEEAGEAEGQKKKGGAQAPPASSP